MAPSCDGEGDRVEEIDQRLTDNNGVDKEGGPQFSPKIFQDIIDKKGDSHRDEGEKAAKNGTKAGVGIDERIEDKADQSPDFALFDLWGEGNKYFGRFWPEEKQNEKDKLERGDGADQSGKSQPAKFPFERESFIHWR